VTQLEELEAGRVDRPPQRRPVVPANVLDRAVGLAVERGVRRHEQEQAAAGP
jgi:hypothetical protein